MNAPAFDALLQRLSTANVRFVLIGGLALNAWGVVRGTKDVDIVADLDSDNLARLAGVAEDAGGHVQTGDSLAGSRSSIAALFAEGERVLIETTLGPLDIVQGLPGVPSYAELISRAAEVEIAGVQVAVCSLEDLRAMKQAAGRTRDLADLEDLDLANDQD